MKNKSVYMQPKKVVADVFNEKGGSLNFKSPSDIPRDRTQIYNINRSNPRKYQTGGKCTTNFDAIIKMSVEGNFARSFEMKENGHARCFLATDQQLLGVKKFCCSSDSILGIDQTFDLGGFYLTCTTYRHPMFVIRDSGRHPLLLGPCMMHLKRETSDYEYFGKTLSGYIKDDVVNVWGSDGEKALINGLQKSNAFQGIHLICEIHARENCERKLKSLNFKEPHINLFLNEIYGQQHGNKRIGGLIDCETEADFDSSLINLGRKWDAIEVTETGRKPPEFFTWFKKFKAEECKRNLLKPIRTAAGLGFPPIRYTNNNNEAINSVLKREVDYKKQSWENMAVSLQNIIHTQYQELEKGVFNVGEYRLHKDYNHLSVSTLNWSQLNKDQKQDKLAKVFRYNAEVTELPTHHIPSVLSETYNSLTGTIYKAHELRDVWRKAGLLAGDKSIFTKLSSNKTCIDCSENVYIVEGNEEMDWFTCTCTGSHKCQNFDKFGVFCEHTIAASEFRGSLQKYIQEIKKCSEKVSLDALLEKHTKKSGKKGSRKGKNDPHTRPVITSSVPLFTEPFHNEDEFEVNFLKDEKRAKRCAACGVDFPKSVVVQPFDLVMQHPERYLYPQKNQGETEWVYTAQKKRATFYHCAPECILKRHPHFTIDKIKIPENVRSKLKPCHIKMLQSHFNMDL
ncbi:uncharacterized protein LOC134257249 [Saccostrea cucullata]|uniref:uncharacterized protein LOC134257249 n=1 Tax=Saccostrea cuccullata TaxID=36930 RepID=UPI002ED6844B